ncbi:MAG: GGDEF domain-containing protein [Proteobacteria bacterium]|jgi:diguanylate cyclase (GGDEF)-like protein|nr:GGDEF domain-containing protein [Pseudomonadota bacterium]MDA1299433.1 GGDEF domain-containing protein [Pseudomonadota bacterium]
MQKSRIYLLLTVNTVVLYGLVLFLLRDSDIYQWIVIGITMALMMVAPNLVINSALNRLEREAAEANRKLQEATEKLDKVRSDLASVTTRDELTGCYNEKYFLEMLVQHSGMSNRGSYAFTLIMLQVDQFSDVVDQHGLASANEMLQLYARIVRAALREVDITARMGSDNFGLILSGASEDEAVMVVNRISQLIGQIQISKDPQLKITNSGGITSYHGTESPQQLIENVNTALEFAIEQGRDRVAGFNYTEPADQDDQTEA